MTSDPKVGVILLNWNTGEFTANCIRSLQQGTLVPWRILVFDNGSTDNSAAWLAETFPAIEVLRSPVNLGFAAANNRAAERLLADGADYLWILNNDTRVDRGCLEALLNEMERDRDIAAASGKIYFMEPPDVLQYAGAFWRPGVLRVRYRGLRERDVGRYDTPCDVGMLSGCHMFVRADVWRTAGGFRENYFAYNEDTEWCLRVVRLGLRLRYVPSAVIWHALSAGARRNLGRALSRKAPPEQEYLQTRNAIFLNREHARRPFQLLVSLADNLAWRFYRAVGLVCLGRWRSAAAILRGIWDGFRLPCR